MIPYTTFLYFWILLYLGVITTLVALIARKRISQLWLLLATAVMLIVQYKMPGQFLPGSMVDALWMVLGYTALMWLISQAALLVRSRGKQPVFFYVSILCALAPLVFVKVALAMTPPVTLGFLGISYLTFRIIDVLIGIEDGLITSVPLVEFFAFILFFPTISSGPIDRYRRFRADWQHARTRSEFFSDLDGTIQRIFRGFLYKFIIAALIKTYWLDAAAGGTGIASIISYMYAYSFYLFFDFAGYSAFAIGASYLFGIHTPENFDKPFLARNIKDFWNRWHISLSSWFRDHVYSRFVFAAIKNRWFENDRVASYLGYAVSMGLMGFWHGLTWYYIVYGLYHALLLSVYEAYSRSRKKTAPVAKPGWMNHAFSIFLTFNLVCFGFLIFSGRLASSFTPPHDSSIPGLFSL